MISNIAIFNSVRTKIDNKVDIVFKPALYIGAQNSVTY